MQALQERLEHVSAEDIHAGHLWQVACSARGLIYQYPMLAACNMHSIHDNPRQLAGGPFQELGPCLMSVQRPLRGGHSGWADVRRNAVSCAGGMVQQARH